MKFPASVHGYLFHEQRPPQPIASGEVCARYQALADDKAFIWLHLNLNHATAEKWLTSHFPVADFFFEEIRSGSHTTRIERQGENLFAVLNDVLFRPQDTSAETATLWLYCSPEAGGDGALQTVAVYRMDAAALADAQGEHVY